MKSLSCRDRLEQALARIADPKGEGSRACLTLYGGPARAAADAADARAANGVSLGPLDGSIVSIKDLFDVAGEPTRAGSKILAEEAKPAAADAPVVRRLRAAGAVIVAKTNMTEFALGGIGANPHFGTPGNPSDRARVPGGSSSGAAVAVADGMCEIAIGTDTGGSVRIPAALCGIVGFKPSRQRVRTDGCFSLEHHARLDRPAGAQRCRLRQGRRRSGRAKTLRRSSRYRWPGFASALRKVCRSNRWTKRWPTTFAAALKSLAAPACGSPTKPCRCCDEMREVNAYGGIVQPEACAVHRDRLKRRAADIDPNVRVRLERGCAVSAADYVDMMQARTRLVRAMDQWLAALDVLVMPTTPIVAPTMAEIADANDYAMRNALVLRNTSIGNFFDLCGISLPLRAKLPVGLMLMARNGQDRMLLRIAAAVEKGLAS